MYIHMWYITCMWYGASNRSACVVVVHVLVFGVRVYVCVCVLQWFWGGNKVAIFHPVVPGAGVYESVYRLGS